MAAKHISESEVSEARFPLNYDCMYELFKRLDGIEDCMNLAESYDALQIVADWTFKTKLNEVKIDFGTIVNIDRILYHVGPFLRSLELKLFDKCRYTTGDLAKIRSTCVELKNLTLIGFDRRRFNEHPFDGTCDDYKLESLSLAHCNFANDEDIFKSITTLQSLNMVGCSGVNIRAIEKCFKNNQGLSSFVCDTKQNRTYLELLHLLPNLVRLEFYYNRIAFDTSFLSNLKSLRSLKLNCDNQNVDHILNELAKRNDLQELELIDVVVNTNTFTALQSFINLRRLIVTESLIYVLTSSNQFPASLETLKLVNFQLSERCIVTLITKHERLGNINLSDCILNIKKSYTSMADLVVRKCNLGRRKVSLALTNSTGPTNIKHMITSTISISNYLTNPNEFKIIFPGLGM